MFVKPIAGKKVADPQAGDFLPDEGRSVEESQYWYRREIDGDVKVSESEPKNKRNSAEDK